RVMNSADLSKACELFKDANKFTSKNNIAKWTKRDLMKFPKYHIVYERNGKIIGAISGTLHKKNLGVIEDISVDEKFRKHGIGDKLIKTLIEKFMEDKVPTIRLWVHWTDAAAIPFYYAHGFRLKMFRHTHGIRDVPDKEDVLFLEKKL
ncbi:MAG: GNAT family N-acetyltransferase, partial [Candidatus Aenigmarchaeota archaeon]|nr:GNAT family N-acetyltransferase [Candidatus Aenigmarchaeota archaeon]